MQFIDLGKQLKRIRSGVDAAIGNVLSHGAFIMGPEVRELERQLAEFAGVGDVVTCGNGTDALVLALMALKVGAGDCVLVPSFTFCATAEAVCLVGAIPYFVDVLEDTYNMDPASLAAGIADARARGLKPRAVITVDLFGQPCDYDRIEPIVREEGLHLVCDAAQAFGASLHGKKIGAFGDVATTSFFPAKPLGCYGDGGAVLTNNEEIAEALRSLRIHGKGRDKYDNVRIGMNSRLDTIQAAILLEKLRIYNDEIEKRNEVAELYDQALPASLRRPQVISGAVSVWAQYTVRSRERRVCMSALQKAGIPTAVYYRQGLHRQTAYERFPQVPGGLPVTEMLEESVFSLPMHPYLSSDEVRIIAEKLAGLAVDHVA